MHPKKNRFEEALRMVIRSMLATMMICATMISPLGPLVVLAGSVLTYYGKYYQMFALVQIGFVLSLVSSGLFVSVYFLNWVLSVVKREDWAVTLAVIRRITNDEE